MTGVELFSPGRAETLCASLLQRGRELAVSDGHQVSPRAGPTGLAFQATSERLSARGAHRALLQKLHARGELYAAGPWADDSGALLIFSGDGLDVDRILATDPYYSTAGVEIVSTREWTPVAGSSGQAGRGSWFKPRSGLLR